MRVEWFHPVNSWLELYFFVWILYRHSIKIKVVVMIPTSWDLIRHSFLLHSHLWWEFVILFSDSWLNQIFMVNRLIVKKVINLKHWFMLFFVWILSGNCGKVFFFFATCFLWFPTSLLSSFPCQKTSLNHFPTLLNIFFYVHYFIFTPTPQIL